MHTEYITLVAAIIAALASIGSLFLNSRLAITREQRLLVWRKEVDRIFVLEELAGRLTEIISSYRSIDANALQEQQNELSDAIGTFRRYGRLKEAIRDLANGLSKARALWGKHEDAQEIKKEIDACYQTLLAECDRILKNRVVKH